LAVGESLPVVVGFSPPQQKKKREGPSLPGTPSGWMPEKSLRPMPCPPESYLKRAISWTCSLQHWHLDPPAFAPKPYVQLPSAGCPGQARLNMARLHHDTRQGWREALVRSGARLEERLGDCHVNAAALGPRSAKCFLQDSKTRVRARRVFFSRSSSGIIAATSKALCKALVEQRVVAVANLAPALGESIGLGTKAFAAHGGGDTPAAKFNARHSGTLRQHVRRGLGAVREALEPRDRSAEVPK